MKIRFCFQSLEFRMERWDWQLEGKALIMESWKKMCTNLHYWFAQCLPDLCLSWNLVAQPPFGIFWKPQNLFNKFLFFLKLSWVAFDTTKWKLRGMVITGCKTENPEVEIKWTSWGLSIVWKWSVGSFRGTGAVGIGYIGWDWGQKTPLGHGFSWLTRKRALSTPLSWPAQSWTFELSSSRWLGRIL